MLHCCVSFARRHVESFSEELEVMNQLFHVGFHVNPRRWRNLVVGCHHRTAVVAQPFYALLDNPVGLAHFFNPHQVTVIAIAVLADRDIEVEQVIHFVRLLLAQIPLNAGTAQHRAGKAHRLGALWRYHTDADQTLFPDTVIGQQSLVLIHVFRETHGEIFDEVQQRTLAIFVQGIDGFCIAYQRCLVLRHGIRQIAINAARTIIGGMHTGAGNGFVAIHQIFTFAECIQQHRHRTDVQRMRADPHQVIQQTRDFIEHDADVLCAQWNLKTEQTFDSHHVAMLVTHHRHIVEAIHVRH